MIKIPTKLGIDIIFTGKRLNIFLQRLLIRQGFLILPLLFYIILEDLITMLNQERKQKIRKRTQDFALEKQAFTKQALCCFSHTSSPFCSVILEMGSSKLFSWPDFRL
jgi:hypothetical protein